MSTKASITAGSRSILRPSRHDPIPPAGTRREHAVIPNLMSPRWRDERREALEELMPFHHDVGGPISPGRLQPIGEPSVGHRLEPVEREGRTRDVTTQPLPDRAKSLVNSGWIGIIG